METLLQALTNDKTRLARGALDAMYAHPFWLERFGERGRRFADQDSEYHLSYLLQALRAGDPALLVKYARWLQALLVSRGMCTLHIVDNFQGLGRALSRELGHEAAPALALLEAACAGLRYPDGAARALQERSERLTRALRAELGPAPASLPARAHDELAYVLAYLADALAQQRPELFAQHAAWNRAFLARHGYAPDWLARALTSLRLRLSDDQGASPQLRQSAAEYVARALLALDSGSAPP